MKNEDNDAVDICVKVSKEQPPTDRGHFKDRDLTDSIKQFVFTYGPCRPERPFVKDPTQKNRHFSETYYSVVNSCGQTIQRFWLCYSPILDAVYCEP